MSIRAVILLPILSLAATAQTPVSNWEVVKMLAPGTEIRVTSTASKPGTSKPIKGTIEKVTDNDLVLMQGRGPRSFPRPQIVSVSVRGKEHRRRNALIGLGVGTAVGLGIGYGIGHSGCSASGGWCGLDTAAGAAIGGIAGLVGGTLTGVFWPTGGWRPIYAP